jgi:WD40 repeat protein
VSAADRWCPLPVATEELTLVLGLMLLPLLWNQAFCKPESSEAELGCQEAACSPDGLTHCGTEVAEEILMPSASQTYACSSSCSIEPESSKAPSQLLATASADGSVMLWDSTGEQSELVHWLVGHTGALSAVTFSVDGSVIATAATDGTTRMWDAESGACSFIFDDGGGVPCSVALSPCGGFLLTGLDDNTLQLWRIPGDKDTEPKDPVSVLSGHESTVASVAFSPSGELAASGSWDATARLWKVGTGSCEQILTGHDAEVFSVAFSGQGDLLATASQDGTARIWSVFSGWCLLTIDEHPSSVRCVAWSPCESFVATGCWDGTVVLWDSQTGEQQNEFSAPAGRGPVHSLAFMAKGSVLATVDGHDARLWSTENGNCFRTLEGHDDTLQSIAVSP